MAAFAGWAWLDYGEYQMRNVAIESAETKSTQASVRANDHAAEFSYGLLLLSGFGTFVSIVGIAVIARTLQATREMTRVTRTASENESRAYLHADGLEAVDDVFGSSGLYLCLLNTGQTPVRWFEVSASGQGISPADLNSLRIDTKDRRIQYRGHAMGAGQTQTVRLTMGELDWKSAFATQQLGVVFGVYGTVRYADIYGREFLSDFAFYTTHIQPRGPRSSNPMIEKFIKPLTSLRSYVDITPEL